MRILLVTILVLFAWVDIAAAKDRVALVIGNVKYQNVENLDNPGRDARAISRALRGHGFDVTQLTNLSWNKMRSALRSFRRKADASEIAFVYYAGHGIEIGGKNFLIAVDAYLEDEQDVEGEAISLDMILRNISGAGRLAMVALDACRDNPFTRSIRRVGATRSIGRGLGAVDQTGSNTLIMFATAPGDVTLDVRPGSNSPFTESFLEALRGPPEDVRLMLGAVKDGVRRRLGSNVDPYVRETLGGDRIVTNQGSRPIETVTLQQSQETPSVQSMPSKSQPEPKIAILDQQENRPSGQLGRNRFLAMYGQGSRDHEYDVEFSDVSVTDAVQKASSAWTSCPHVSVAGLGDCIALARNASGAWQWIREGTKEAAQQNALKLCDRKYGDCKLINSFCTAPGTYVPSQEYPEIEQLSPGTFAVKAQYMAACFDGPETHEHVVVGGISRNAGSESAKAAWPGACKHFRVYSSQDQCFAIAANDEGGYYWNKGRLTDARNSALAACKGPGCRVTSSCCLQP